MNTDRIISEQKHAQSLIENSTLQFIDKFDESNPVMRQIAEEEIQSLNPEELNEVINEVDEQISEICQELDRKIDAFFADEAPQIPSEEQIEEIIGILEEESKIIEEKLKSKKKSAEMGREVTEYLTNPLLGLGIGIHIAEKIKKNLPEEVHTTLLASSKTKTALGFLGLGMECFALQKQSAVIRQKSQEKEALLKLVQKESNPKKIESLDLQIEALSHEIDSLQEHLNEEIKEVTEKFIVKSFSEAANILELVANSKLIDLHADVMKKLLIASNDISFAGSLISLGWNCYQVAHQASHLSRTSNKIDELKEISAKINQAEDVFVAYIIKAKLDRLANVKIDYQMGLATKIVNMCASSLAVAAATNTALITAEVAVGTTASLVLTASGGIGMVLAGGVIAVGLGVAAYQNRYEIEHAAKSVSIESQKLIVKTQLQLAEKTYKATSQKLKEIENSQHKIGRHLQSLQEKPGIVTKNKNKNEIVKEMKSRESENKMAFQLIQKYMVEMNEVIEKEQLCMSTIKTLRHDLESLEKRKVDIELDRTIKNFRKKFRFYDNSTLNAIKKVLAEGLSQSDSKRRIRTFLLQQNFSAKHSLSLEDVLDYILSPK